MEPIDIQAVLQAKVPGLSRTLSPFLFRIFAKVITSLLCLPRINSFLARTSHMSGIGFLDAVFEELKITYSATRSGINNIPSEGRVIIAANHPFGGLDGLLLLKLVLDVRSDVVVAVNDILLVLNPLQQYFLPIDVINGRNARKNILLLEDALMNERAVIFFPAGEVSRLRLTKVRDRAWHKGAVRLAARCRAPILPVHIGGRNSVKFLLLSMLNKRLAMLLLPMELFNKRGTEVKFTIGRPIPSETFSSGSFNVSHITKQLRKHTYNLPSGKPGRFKTYETIIHPVDRKTLKYELKASQQLGSATDGKRIVLVDAHSSQSVVREVARLREVTFRRVGEGTGKKADSDNYDTWYSHIVVWDEETLEIAG